MRRPHRLKATPTHRNQRYEIQMVSFSASIFQTLYGSILNLVLFEINCREIEPETMTLKTQINNSESYEFRGLRTPIFKHKDLLANKVGIHNKLK